jgi:hypothetical protein
MTNGRCCRGRNAAAGSRLASDGGRLHANESAHLDTQATARWRSQEVSPVSLVLQQRPSPLDS